MTDQEHHHRACYKTGQIDPTQGKSDGDGPPPVEVLLHADEDGQHAEAEATASHHAVG